MKRQTISIYFIVQLWHSLWHRPLVCKTQRRINRACSFEEVTADVTLCYTPDLGQFQLTQERFYSSHEMEQLGGTVSEPLLPGSHQNTISWEPRHL